MADSTLKDPVLVQANRIDATLLPTSFSQPYRLYVIQQSSDFGAIAGKANEAGQGAYDAQVKNEEQDETLAQHGLKLADHESRITANEAELAEHEQRITSAESKLENHEQRITSNEQELANHEGRITQNTQDIATLDSRLDQGEVILGQLQEGQSTLSGRLDQGEQAINQLSNDYVSKSQTNSQSIASPISVATSYSVNGTKVVGARVSGFTAATGDAAKGPFDANLSLTVSATYVAAEAQGVADAMTEARKRIKALEDALRAHGLIN